MRLQVDLEHGSLVIAAVGAPRAALAKPAAVAKGATTSAATVLVIIGASETFFHNLNSFRSALCVPWLLDRCVASSNPNSCFCQSGYHDTARGLAGQEKRSLSLSLSDARSLSQLAFCSGSSPAGLGRTPS